MTDFSERFQTAMEKSMLRILAAVETGVVTGVAVGQATGGAAGQTAGGAVEATQGSSQQHTGASHKNDVSAPELTESYNVSMLQDVAHMSKVNARTFDAVSSAITMLALGSVGDMHQQMMNETGHADEEFSARKRATVISLVTVGDAVEEGADDSDRK